MRRGIALAAFLIAAVVSAVALTHGRTAPAPDNRLQGAFRKPAVSGWTLRGVVDGTAMLEGPYGTWKAARGDTVPGLGRVDSIVLWGNRWIVATSRGLVTTP